MRLAVAPLLASVWSRGLDLLFPPRCVSCGSFGAFLCVACLAKTPRAQPPRCPVCWMPGSGDVCGRCRHEPFAFEAARCPFVYAGAARDAVHALKYRGVSAVAGVMAQAMAECLTKWPPQEVVALVPELSRLSGLPLLNGLLVRRKAAPPQARATDEAARRANVADAFAVRRREAVGGPLILVDDVMTSGATLDACALALCEGGHNPVYALTFARED